MDKNEPIHKIYLDLLKKINEKYKGACAGKFTALVDSDISYVFSYNETESFTIFRIALHGYFFYENSDNGDIKKFTEDLATRIAKLVKDPSDDDDDNNDEEKNNIISVTDVLLKVIKMLTNVRDSDTPKIIQNANYSQSNTNEVEINEIANNQFEKGNKKIAQEKDDEIMNNSILKEELFQTKEKLRIIAKENGENISKYNEIKEELTKIANENDKNKTDFESLNSEYEEFKSNYENLKSELIVIKQNQEEIRDENKRINEMHSKSSRDLKKQKEIEIQRIKDECKTEIEKIVTDSEAKIKQNEAECKAKIEKIEADSEAKIKQKETECKAKIEQKEADIRAFFEQKEEEIKEIKEKYGPFKLNELKRKLIKQNEIIKVLKAQDQRQKSELGAISSQFEELNKNFLMEQKRSNNLEKRMEKLEEKYNVLAVKYNGIQSKYIEIAKDREELIEENEDLRSQIEELKENEKMPSDGNLYESYCTEKRLDDLEKQINAIFNSSQNNDLIESHNILVKEVGFILKKFHTLLTKYNENAPNENDFYNKFKSLAMDEKFNYLESLVRNCKP